MNYPIFSALGIFFCIWELYKINNLQYIFYASNLIKREKEFIGMGKCSEEYLKEAPKLFQISLVENIYLAWVIYGFFTPFVLCSLVITFFTFTKNQLAKNCGNLIYYIDGILTIFIILFWIYNEN